jgi:tetratricopeptide (TPR) repeat protein
MANYQLRTLGGLSLSGTNGPVQLQEPRLAALVVLLAVGGDAGVSEDELLLRLTPELKAERARAELTRLIALARSTLGGDASVRRVHNGYAFTPALVELDVFVAPSPTERDCAEFLAGFKLPGNPEFRDWLAATRHRVVPRTGPGQEAAAAPDRRTPRAAVVAALITGFLAVIAAGAWLARPRAVQGLATGDPVILADVRNETGDSLFDTGILSAATVALQQSGKFRLYSRSRLPEVYRLMQVPNRDAPLTFELAQEVAERDRVRFVLGLQVDRAGNGYRVKGRLADVQLKRPVVETTEAARAKADVLPALDRVLRALRGQLGESRRDIANRQRPLPLVTTASLEALHSYADGAAAWSKGDFPLAGELFHRAVDIDTGFAMAYGALGNWYYYNHDRTNGERNYGEALKRDNRLTERERLGLLQGLTGYRGNADSSIALTATLATRFPSVTTWYSYGTTLLQNRRYLEAISALRTGLSYDSSSVNTHINLATSLKALGRNEEALQSYAAAERRDSAVLYRNNINHEWGGTLVLLGRLAEAESAYRRMASSGTVGNRALGLRSLGFLALWRGQVDQAIGYFRDATEATVQMKAPLSEARNRLLLASAYRLAGRDADASAEVSRALALRSSPLLEPRFLAMLANSCLQLGRVADAEAVLQLMRTRRDLASGIDSAADAFVSAAVQLARRRPDSALVLVRRSERIQQDVNRLMIEADAFRALGKPDSARAALAHVLEQRGYGFEGEDQWLRAHVLLGDLLLAKGDTAEAVKSYQRLVDQWRGATGNPPDLVAARSRLATLNSPRR